LSWAAVGLKAFHEKYNGSEDVEMLMSDFLADFFHLAAHFKIDIGWLVDKAREDFEAEIEGENETRELFRKEAEEKKKKKK